MLDQDKRHLATLIHSNDQAALVQLTSMQEQLKDSERRLEKLAKQVGLQPPASAFARVFLPPCPPDVLDLPDPFQLLEYQWGEERFDKQTSSSPPSLCQVYN